MNILFDNENEEENEEEEENETPVQLGIGSWFNNQISLVLVKELSQ